MMAHAHAHAHDPEPVPVLVPVMPVCSPAIAPAGHDVWIELVAYPSTYAVVYSCDPPAPAPEHVLDGSHLRVRVDVRDLARLAAWLQGPGQALLEAVRRTRRSFALSSASIAKRKAALAAALDALAREAAAALDADVT
jgi:hypothetical protein